MKLAWTLKHLTTSFVKLQGKANRKHLFETLAVSIVVQPGAEQSGAVRCRLVQCGPVQSGAVQSGAMQYNQYMT